MDLILALVCLGLLAIALLFAGLRLGIPGLVCFLLIGILAGPYALGVVTDQSVIETIGEIGVILLLFAIGLEFSFKNLLGSWRLVLIGGCLQVLTTIVSAFLVTFFFLGLRFAEAIFFGFLVSLSSTAIVMKVLQERGEVETVPGRTLLGILIFQDLAIIPMLLLTPVLMGTGGSSFDAFPLQLAKVIGILALLILSAVWIVPRFLYYVARQKSRELFIFSVAAICFAVAWLTSAAGLSYSLGAFVAGLMIGGSDFRIDAVSSIIPFRDVFAAIFFMSIGMLMDPGVLFSHTDIVVTLLVIILGVKTATGSYTALFLGMPPRVAVFTGLVLAQIGEFSFVLARSALGSNLIGEGPYQVFLASAIITMAATPFMMNSAPLLTSLIYRVLPSWRPEDDRPDGLAEAGMPRDHIVIAGYGMTGKSVARAAEISGIPYTVIDLDPDVVRREQMAGVPVIFGDASGPEVLEHAGIQDARAIVIVISEQNIVPRIVRMARQLSPKVSIVVRTRHVSDVAELLDLGADEVIPEEIEISIRIFSRVLEKYALPERETGDLIAKISAYGERVFTRDRPGGKPLAPGFEDALGSSRIHTLPVSAGARAAGKTLQDLDALVREIRILAIRRGDETITTLPQTMEIQPGDFLIVLAPPQDIRALRTLVSGDTPAGNAGGDPPSPA